jgi:hypothetical protein
LRRGEVRTREGEQRKGEGGRECGKVVVKDSTANNFGFIYSRNRISQDSFPNFYLYISKFIHEILSGTTRSQKEL